VLELTHSALAVGVLGFFFYGPYALLGLIGGALADRFNRRRTLIVTQSAMAVAAAGLALVAFLHVDFVWVIYLIAALRGMILVFNNPSRQALIVQLVGRAELPNAIGLNSTINNATRVIGPAIAGLLIAGVGIGWCFALNAISFVPVIGALFLMRESEFHKQLSLRSRTPFLVSIADGLRYAKRTKAVAVVLLMLFVISLLAINFSILLPILARQTMHGGPEIFGYISACFGFGALVGALVSASRARASRGLVVVAAIGFGAAQLLLATQQAFLGVALALFVTGIFYTIYASMSNSIVQLATPGFLQGRVGGLYTYVFLASGPFGSLLAGWLSQRGGTGLAFAVGGIASIAMAAVGFLTWPWPMPASAVTRRRAVRRRSS
jgi:MFS family permease